ncbi:unnamed protein product [Cochlearia groenlandica]
MIRTGDFPDWAADFISSGDVQFEIPLSATTFIPTDFAAVVVDSFVAANSSRLFVSFLRRGGFLCNRRRRCGYAFVEITLTIGLKIVTSVSPYLLHRLFIDGSILQHVNQRLYRFQSEKGEDRRYRVL